VSGPERLIITMEKHDNRTVSKQALLDIIEDALNDKLRSRFSVIDCRPDETQHEG